MSLKKLEKQSQTLVWTQTLKERTQLFPLLCSSAVSDDDAATSIVPFKDTLSGFSFQLSKPWASLHRYSNSAFRKQLIFTEVLPSGGWPGRIIVSKHNFLGLSKSGKSFFTNWVDQNHQKLNHLDWISRGHWSAGLGEHCILQIYTALHCSKLKGKEETSYRSTIMNSTRRSHYIIIAVFLALICVLYKHIFEKYLLKTMRFLIFFKALHIVTSEKISWGQIVQFEDQLDLLGGHSSRTKLIKIMTFSISYVYFSFLPHHLGLYW